MRFFKTFLFIQFFFCIGITEIFGQLPAFNGFWLTPQLVAPTAMAGEDVNQISAHYRRQGIQGMEGGQVYLLSGQFPLYNRANTHFGTFGINVIQEETGSSYLLSTTGALLTYLYDASISSTSHLVAGVQGSYFGRKLDWSDVRTGNQAVGGVFDPARNTGELLRDDPSRAFLANIGLAYYLTDFEGDPVFHIGAALTNANEGSFSYLAGSESQTVPSSLVGYTNLRLFSNQYYDVLSDVYMLKQNNMLDVTGGFRLRKGINPRMSVSNNHLGFGMYYSAEHTGILALQLVSPGWLVGISYDMVFGDQHVRNIRNGVEVSLGWRALHQETKRSYKPSKFKKKSRYKKKLPWKKRRGLPWMGR